MPSPTAELPDTAPLPRDLLARVSAARATADDAERAILVLAVEWAVANPPLPGDESWEPAALPVWHETAGAADLDLADHADLNWHGIPAVRWDAPAAFAAANGMSTTAGKAVIRDALVLARRTPRFWKALHDRAVTAWQARHVAQALAGQHDDVCRAVETAIIQRLASQQSIGRIVVARLVDEAMLRLHAEERELDQIEALDHRHVTIDVASIGYTGIAHLEADADWADLAALDEKLSELAHAMADLPDHANDTFDVRRSIALGILADPARAQAILDGDVDAKPSRLRPLNADLHLTEGGLLLGDAVTGDVDLRAHLTQVIQQWAGRSDADVTVKPIRHCGGVAGGCRDCPGHVVCDDHSAHAPGRYVPSPLDRKIVELAARRCVHPWCNRAVRHCDLDHITPYDPDDPGRGPTCPVCNLAPLCRHHHRLKTHAGWRYWKTSPDSYLWRDPQGLLYLRTRDGTRPLA